MNLQAVCAKNWLALFSPQLLNSNSISCYKNWGRKSLTTEDAIDAAGALHQILSSFSHDL